MSDRAANPYSVEERLVHGETRWVAIRARGSEWSWLTPEEAASIGRAWVERYGRRDGRDAACSAEHGSGRCSPKLVMDKRRPAPIGA